MNFGILFISGIKIKANILLHEIRYSQMNVKVRQKTKFWEKIILQLKINKFLKKEIAEKIWYSIYFIFHHLGVDVSNWKMEFSVLLLFKSVSRASYKQ